MSEFKLNLSDSENVFIIKHSDLENRFDPHFYKPEFNKLTKKLKSNKYKHLGDLISFSNETWNQVDYFDNEFPYIEISEINTDTGEIGVIKSIPKTEAPSRARKIVRKNDIIVSTTRPSRGAIAFIDEKHDFHIASTGFSVLRNIKSDIISKDFLFVMLRQYFSLLQMEQRSSGGNYPAITEDELKKVIIPILESDKQQQIYKLFQQAFISKQQKENQANELLKNIDDYILTELGIILPTKDNSLQNRVFTTTFSKVSGNRFDPKQYETFAQNLFNSIENSQYDKIQLKKLIIQSIAGDWGLDENLQVEENEYTKCMVIRATEFDNEFNLNIENSRAKYRLIKNEKLQKLDIKINDLLIEKSGGSPDQPVGRISILTEDLVNNNILCYSNFIHKIRVNTNYILPEYLFCFLKTIHNIKITEIMQSQTNGIRNLIMREYFNQKIVLPNLTKQQEISEKANEMRNKAKQLREEAINELNKAREIVEKMILE